MFNPTRYIRRKFTKHRSPSSKSYYPKTLTKGTGLEISPRLKPQFMTMNTKPKDSSVQFFRRIPKHAYKSNLEALKSQISKGIYDTVIRRKSQPVRILAS
ncbi:unnamed protein product [Moneuplotes crassus]|uniref:Uncharacterized protein n=1 Tax=Euplotes crassus TaxID=5936 RepID=A0AAD1XN22_EUPCR|nr:unnamed protein product [Moneuplotes crassus]